MTALNYSTDLVFVDLKNEKLIISAGLSLIIRTQDIRNENTLPK
jgi:hypothetical protein